MHNSGATLLDLSVEILQDIIMHFNAHDLCKGPGSGLQASLQDAPAAVCHVPFIKVCTQSCKSLPIYCHSASYPHCQCLWHATPRLLSLMY